MKKIVWIGSYMTDKQFANIPIKTAGQLSAFTSERSLVGGIDVNIQNTSYTMDTIGVSAGVSYPNAEMFKKRNEFQRKEGTNDVHAGFLNLPFINRCFKAKAYKNESKKESANSHARYVFPTPFIPVI